MLHTTYRPQTLSEVSGQEQNLLTLKKQIDARKYSSTYLFAGHRGTGKTTIARILARAICCEHPTSDGPCNECRNCRMILEGKTMDFIELDAASNNTIADIKELVSSTMYMPSVLPKKIYIIDEVHNLSASAFDALLKTIEEPPDHCVFIMCTTEMHKIPATIRSRSSIYQFSTLTPETISRRLAYVLDDIGKEYEEKALELIARQAEGSMRDALSICERLIISCDVLTGSYVTDTLCLLDESVTFELIDCIIREDPSAGINCLKKIYEEGNNLSQLTENMIQCLADCIIAKCGGTAGDGQCPESFREHLLPVIEDIRIELLFWYVDQFCKLKETIRNTLNPFMDTMLTLIKCCNPDLLEEDRIYLISRINQLEEKVCKLASNAPAGQIQGSNAFPETQGAENPEESSSTPAENNAYPFRGEGREGSSGDQASEPDPEEPPEDIFTELLGSFFDK